MVEYQVWDKSKGQTWFFDIIFSSRGEAEYVLSELYLRAIEDDKKRVSMHDYFRLSRVPDPNEDITKHLKWPLEVIKITKVYEHEQGGYYIGLPKVVMIDA